jgi:hypothetical protein
MLNLFHHLIYSHGSVKILKQLRDDDLSTYQLSTITHQPINPHPSSILPHSGKLLIFAKSLNMKKVLSLFVLVMFVAVGNAQPPDVPAEKGSKFGAEITTEKAVPVEEMVKTLTTKEGDKKMEVKVQGTVVEVCQAEGCWLRMKNGESNIMVRMKDHKWFVPTALNGKTIVLQGTAEVKETSVAQLKHYAEDANKSKAEIDAIKEPKKEVLINATGIVVI